MATYSLVDVAAAARGIGRAAIFYGSTYSYVASTTGADLALTHLGDTEGEVNIAFNESFTELKLPEIMGDAIVSRKLAGENPMVTMPMFTADKTLRGILSPTNSAHGGYNRPRAVTQHVLAIIPEEVFIESNAAASLVFTNTAGTGAWTVGGDAATAAQLALLDKSIWFWAGHFEKPDLKYAYESNGKLVQPVKFQPMVNGTMPDGHQLYTIGRPDQASTPILIDAA